MKKKIEIEERFSEERHVHIRTLMVQVGERQMFLEATGPTPERADHELCCAFDEAATRLEKIGDIWKRSNRFNWWAAEHSKEERPK